MSSLLRPGDVGHAEASMWMRRCAEVAAAASCLRSRCGSVVVQQGVAIGSGHNAPPDGCPPAACFKQSLPAAFRSDRTCCVHAEQNAILDALTRHPGAVRCSRIYFVRLDSAGQMAPSGAPYCTICSKLTQAAGIAEFTLLRAGGVIETYGADEYNRLSFRHADHKD